MNVDQSGGYGVIRGVLLNSIVMERTIPVIN
jgi:hypothetical protein